MHCSERETHGEQKQQELELGLFSLEEETLELEEKTVCSYLSWKTNTEASSPQASERPGLPLVAYR